MPASTIHQFDTIDATISENVGWCLRARNASVSFSERRMMKMNGTISEPIKNGMRQPQSDMACGIMVVLRT